MAAAIAKGCRPEGQRYNNKSVAAHAHSPLTTSSGQARMAVPLRAKLGTKDEAAQAFYYFFRTSKNACATGGQTKQRILW